MAETENKYNYFFNKIVKNENDLVGSIAYIFYKRNKMEFIEQYKKEHGDEPDINILRDWQKNECTQSKLENYNKIAQQRTTEFVNNLQKDKEKAYKKKEAELERKDKEIAKRNQYCHVKSKGQFGVGVLQNLLSSFIFIIICFLLILYLRGHADLMGLLQELLTVK